MGNATYTYNTKISRYFKITNLAWSCRREMKKMISRGIFYGETFLK